MIDEERLVNFQVPATLRKWPSLNNRRRDDRKPYIVAEGTLESCIREFMGKPEATLDEIPDPSLHSIFPSKIKCCVDQLRPPPKADIGPLGPLPRIAYASVQSVGRGIGTEATRVHWAGGDENLTQLSARCPSVTLIGQILLIGSFGMGSRWTGPSIVKAATPKLGLMQRSTSEECGLVASKTRGFIGRAGAPAKSRKTVRTIEASNVSARHIETVRVENVIDRIFCR
jgi:hypothetical protein